MKHEKFTWSWSLSLSTIAKAADLTVEATVEAPEDTILERSRNEDGMKPLPLLPDFDLCSVFSPSLFFIPMPQNTNQKYPFASSILFRMHPTPKTSIYFQFEIFRYSQFKQFLRITTTFSRKSFNCMYYLINLQLIYQIIDTPQKNGIFFTNMNLGDPKKEVMTSKLQKIKYII